MADESSESPSAKIAAGQSKTDATSKKTKKKVEADAPKKTGVDDAPQKLAIEEVATKLAAPVKAGATKLDVADIAGFAVGDAIQIGTEANVIIGFGSILLQKPLVSSYPVGTAIRKIKDAAADEQSASSGAAPTGMSNKSRGAAAAMARVAQKEIDAAEPEEDNAVVSMLMGSAADTLLKSQEVTAWGRQRIEAEANMSMVNGAGSCGPQALPTGEKVPIEQRWDTPKYKVQSGIGAGPVAGYGEYVRYNATIDQQSLREQRHLCHLGGAVPQIGRAGRLPRGLDEPLYSGAGSMGGAGSAGSAGRMSPGGFAQTLTPRSAATYPGSGGTAYQGGSGSALGRASPSTPRAMTAPNAGSSPEGLKAMQKRLDQLGGSLGQAAVMNVSRAMGPMGAGSGGFGGSVAGQRGY